MILEAENTFTLDYYGSILTRAKMAGYLFTSFQQHWSDGCPDFMRFILRHDVDTNPLTLKGVLDVEASHDVPSTVFVRVTGNTYNPFDYRTYPLFNRVIQQGGELGLHSNFVEFARLHNMDSSADILAALQSETQALRAFYPTITGLACHRDLNYVYNSLPWLEENWELVRATTGLTYQAYDPLFMNSLTYVNETAEQRLGWRGCTPERAIETGRSICMSTHPHWWFRNHPFEV